MTQHWTKTKPNRPGYWWSLRNEQACIVEVLYIDDLLHCDNLHKDEYYNLSDEYFKNYLWGSSPLCEPVGEKI